MLVDQEFKICMSNQLAVEKMVCSEFLEWFELCAAFVRWIQLLWKSEKQLGLYR
jgi:hypothetical protein